MNRLPRYQMGVVAAGADESAIKSFVSDMVRVDTNDGRHITEDNMF